MSVFTDTHKYENGCVSEAGNHKGCPYNGFVGVYFRSNGSGGGAFKVDR